jgi:mRNA interferase RelE/StbE
MEIAFTPAAWRDWQKLPKQIRSRLETKLLTDARDPLRHAVKLTSSVIGQYRFRVGDYRIVFDLSENLITILAVGHRKDIYRG